MPDLRSMIFWKSCKTIQIPNVKFRSQLTNMRLHFTKQNNTETQAGFEEEDPPECF